MTDNYKKFLELTKNYPSKPSLPNQAAPTQGPTEPPQMPKRKYSWIPIGVGIVLTALVLYSIDARKKWLEKKREKRK